MSLAPLLTVYLSLNLLVIVAVTGLFCARSVISRLKLSFSAASELKLHYQILLVIAILCLGQPWLPHHEFFQPPAKVWSAESLKKFGTQYSVADSEGYLSLPTSAGSVVLRAEVVSRIWVILVGLLLMTGVGLLIRDLRTLIAIQKRSLPLKKIGAVRILVNQSIAVPFSFWLPGQANVVIPATLIDKPRDFCIAVAHEIQHHRHGDTKWIFAIWGLRLVCVMNPFVYFWNKWIMEIQEFACDESLIGHQKVDSHEYARCLVEVAQSSLEQKFEPVCATGLAFLVGGNLLKRRIEKMLSQSEFTSQLKSHAHLSFRTCSIVGVVLASVLGATVWAAKGVVQDRRVTLEQAQALAHKAQSDSGFPVTINEAVLRQLNRYLGTPEGRDFIRGALARRETYSSTIKPALQKYGVPEELLEIPIVESGYQNMTEAESHTTGHAAGLWQFIPSTARVFEMTVSSQKDDRIDVGMETDAAIRYLLSNKLRFNDWLLSILAFNMGEKAVQDAIEAVGSRDAWTLIRNGYEGDKDYLAKVMAAVLIVKNPDFLN